MNIKTTVGKLLYGATFIILLPILLITWAIATERLVNLPVPSNDSLNMATVGVGLVLMITGMINLWQFGKGLPMNAFPPQYYVTKGAFALTKNPIYLGAVICSFGLSALLRSSSGFWLISPLFALMVIAYTVGFEKERTLKKFGYKDHRTFLSLPADIDEQPTFRDRLATAIISFSVWLLVYEAFVLAGIPKDAIVSNSSLDDKIPLVESSEVVYLLAYPFALLLPFVIKSKKHLRNFALDVWTATGLSAFIYFTLPFISNQQEFVPGTYWGKLIFEERAYDSRAAALPACHVIWALISAFYFTKSYPRLKIGWWLIALMITISCVTTHNHSVADVLAAVIVYLVAVSRQEIWDIIRGFAERIANSWKEWRYGPMRIINHGFYAGAAAFVGTLVIGSTVPSEFVYTAFVSGLFAIVGAALWAQVIEGSPKLQRPFGYYGSVVAVIFCCLLWMLMGLNFFALLGAVTLSAPWVQVLGRLRCLVQGCCHGKPAPEWLGIHFNHPKSRVNKISGLKGVCIHPTQLYSIGSNIVIGIILIRLKTLDMPASFIAGLYFLLNALARFVEEFFRGEAQTPYWAGMRIYQWIAILNMILGAIFTCLPSTALPPFQLTVPAILWALGLGVFATMAYGVDFPASTRRFARLTSN